MSKAGSGAGLRRHRYKVIDDPDAKLIDSFGKTVREAVDTYVFDKVPKNKASRKIKKIWYGLMTDQEIVV